MTKTSQSRKLSRIAALAVALTGLMGAQAALAYLTPRYTSPTQNGVLALENGYITAYCNSFPKKQSYGIGRHWPYPGALPWVGYASFGCR